MTDLRTLFSAPWFWALVAVAVSAGIAGIVGLYHRALRHLEAFERERRAVSGYMRGDDVLPVDPRRAALDAFRREGQL